MNYNYKLFLDPDSEINWEVIINEFIKFYGEEHRNLIENKFSSLKKMWYLKKEDVKEYKKNIEKDIEKNKYKELIKLFDGYFEDKEYLSKELDLLFMFDMKFDSYYKYLNKTLILEEYQLDYYHKRFLNLALAMGFKINDEADFDHKIDWIEFNKRYLECYKLKEDIKNKYNNVLSKFNYIDNILADIDNNRIEDLPINIKSKKLIESLPLAYSDDYINIINDNIICITVNVSKDSGELLPILYFNPLNGMPEYQDVCFIHELNHLIETSIIKNEYDENHNFISSYFVSGFDFGISDCREDETPPLDREYALFNEVINQMIALEITKQMHGDNIYIFNTPENSKLLGGANYEHMIQIAQSFYNNFQKEILKSRVSGDMNFLLSLVGKDNFKELNQLFGEYQSYHNKYYETWDSETFQGEKSELFKKANDLALKMITYRDEEFIKKQL